jgi:hypothetical protein
MSFSMSTFLNFETLLEQKMFLVGWSINFQWLIEGKEIFLMMYRMTSTFVFNH